jgi:hypothetical protein
MTRPAKKAYEAVTLLASAAQTATGTASSSVYMPVMQAAAFVLDVTAAATATGDTLDVYVQTKLDGTNWVDVVHFTQVLGDGGAKRYYAKLTSHLATAEFENGAALGAAAVRNLIGDEWQVRWAITDADTDDASFTFSVSACPM